MPIVCNQFLVGRRVLKYGRSALLRRAAAAATTPHVFPVIEARTRGGANYRNSRLAYVR
jgi:hypothetical protein